MRKVKVGLAQMSCGPDKEQNIARYTEKVRQLAADGAQIICLQELFASLYFCDVEEETVETQMTASELAKGFHPVWETPEVICRVNDAIQTQPWQKRDTELIRMMLDGRVKRRE